MKNPFIYGGTVTGDAFCNRTVELQDLKTFADNSNNIFIFGERRLGKTSLLNKLISKLPEDDYIPIYVDLWVCNTEESLVKVCAQAFTSVLEKASSKLLKKAKELFSSFSPSIVIDSEGNPQLVFNTVEYKKNDPVLEKVFDLPQIIADKYHEKQVVVIFDEFQQIRNMESDRAERILRSTIQNHSDVSYFFCGSKKHIINDMFMNKKSPLFRSAGHYPIDVISTEHWLKYISHNFSATGRKVDDEMIKEILKITGNHPFYTQLLCHVLWEITESGEKAEVEMLEKAVALLLNREQYAYTTLWETLSLNVQRMLTAVAKEKDMTSPYSGNILKKYGIKTASTAQKAIEKLKSEEIIDISDEGIYFISDRFFSLWISSKFDLF